MTERFVGVEYVSLSLKYVNIAIEFNVLEFNLIILGSVGLNIIGVPKMRNRYGAIQLLIFQYVTFLY